MNFKAKKSSRPKKEQQTIDLEKLPGKIGPVVDFLREHVRKVKGRVSSRGNQIQVEGLKHKEVKLLLHKFVRHKGLEDHRVLSQSGILEIVPRHLPTHAKREEGTPPPAAATMPYFFPGTPALLGTEKKPRKKS